MELFVQADYGTDSQVRLVLNPVFVLLMNGAMANIRAVAELFGLRRSQ